MGIMRRSDSLYVEFKVIDDGHTLRLAAPDEGGKVKRRKCHTLKRELGKQ